MNRTSILILLVRLAVSNVSTASETPLTAPERSAVLSGAARALDSLYVDRSIARSMATALQRSAAQGRWSSIVDPRAFADSITQVLRGLSHDEHVRIYVDAKDQRQVANVTPAEREKRRARVLEEIADANYGFPELRILPGNIGLLRMDNFNQPSLAAPTLEAAMSFLHSTRALIIDLRHNGGGHADQMTLFMSYFLGSPVMIGETFSRPDSTIEQTWTYAAVPGPRYDAGKPLFILTSPTTFSAAEALAVGLRTQRKAVLVGEQTRGGVNQGDFLPIGTRFMMFVPSVASTHPNDIEGKGLRPDVIIPSDQALESAHRLALRAVLPTIQDPERRAAFEQIARAAAEGQEPAAK
jgi:C-terminal processing protease CtpA/Prc